MIFGCAMDVRHGRSNDGNALLTQAPEWLGHEGNLAQ